MRQVEENALWNSLRTATTLERVTINTGDGTHFRVPDPCTILGGWNGSGKTRTLRSIKAGLKDKGLYLDLHHLVEQSMVALRSRDDIADMTEEYDSAGPDAKGRDHLHRVINRVYDSVEWFSLELEPTDEQVVETFKWNGEQSLVPYFRARFQGTEYSSLSMGLGEYSVHMLFWILEQYREVSGLTLLLDEPDAFLPPVGVRALLHRLMSVCLDRGWQMVIATHSEEMISLAVEQEAFVLVRSGPLGAVALEPSVSDSAVADHLLTRPATENMLFVEDESAWYLARAAIASENVSLARTTAITWGGGEGYLAPLVRSLPRPPDPNIRFAVAPDGDQRERFGGKGKWPVCFLPTHEDPDDLYKSLRHNSDLLAARLGTIPADFARYLDSIEGHDGHDWVNAMGLDYGRHHVLSCLSQLWVELNGDASRIFVEELKHSWHMS